MRSLIRTERDLGVDIVRGLALRAIFVNHMPGNWLGRITPRNCTLLDATEPFLLLAGYAAGLAHGSLLDRKRCFFAASRLMGRFVTLHVAQVFLLVVFTAQVALSAGRLETAAYQDEPHLDPLAGHPYRALLQGLLRERRTAAIDRLNHCLARALGASIRNRVAAAGR